MNNFLLHPLLYFFWEFLVECLEWTSSHQCTSWGWGRSSRFGMNQKHILPCPKFLVFSISYLPQSFSLLPTSLLLTSPLLPPFHLYPPSYLPPTYLPPPTYLTSFCVHSIVKARKRLKWEPPSSEFKSAWSGTHHRQSSWTLEGGPTIIKAWERLKQNPELIGQSRSLKVNSLPSLFGFVTAIAFFIFSVTRKKAMVITIITFFFLFLLQRRR